MSTGPVLTGGAETGWQVSSHGRVNNPRGRTSHGCLQPTGYYRVKMSGISFYVHRVVALAFLGPPPDEATWQVHHRDGNKANNHLDNLQYVTQSQNILASFASRSRRCCKAQNCVPVMWRSVGSQSWTTSPSMAQAAAELGISKHRISQDGCRQSKIVKGYQFQFAESAETRMLDGEEWRQLYDPVSGTEIPGRLVSSMGRVKSKNGRISLGCLEKSGYYRAGITLTSHKRSELVHRLVAYAFLGPPVTQRRNHVNHKDLDKGNNAVDNLEYVTPAENLAHRFAASGSSRRSFARPVMSRNRCSQDEWRQHASVREAALVLGVHAQSIYSCLSGRRLHAGGYEFRSAPFQADQEHGGEEWRLIDMFALVKEKDTRLQRIRLACSPFAALTEQS